jgi:lipopolysaccharide export system permease protein
MAFGVVMFVFTMQTMWKFVDDIIGKGASAAMIVEFVFYLSLGLMPTALPAAILLSSLYIMGNLSERYELTSMKSAGISIWRIMRPLIAVCGIISVFSFICSNYIAPTANLKFKTRLYNFKSQKLALSLNEGVFNDDFRNYAIRIDEKDDETDQIKNIMLYDHSLENRNRTKIIMAEEGYMDLESDERFLIMNLENGRQYQEMEEAKGRKPSDPRKYPYLRIKFKKLEKYLDLKEFEMRDTDEDVFKEQEQMMSMRQLIYEMDTMQQKIVKKKKYLTNTLSTYYHFVKTSDSTSYYIPMAETIGRKNSSTKNKYTSPKKESLDFKGKKNKGKKAPSPALKRPDTKKQKPTKSTKPVKKKQRSARQPANPKRGSPASSPTPIKKKLAKKYKIAKVKFLGKPATFEEILMPKHRANMLDRATTALKSVKDKSLSDVAKVQILRDKHYRYGYQVHLKFSLAAACMIFLFIGAPLGAIIRKGGFGYPILFGVFLFVLFVALLTVFKKLGEGGSLPYYWMPAWIPVIIFFIPCFFLTLGAVKDVKAMNMDALESWMKGSRIVKLITRLMGA